MAQLPVVRRTEKLREITAILKSERTVFLSAFFYSGKTVLLDQLCASWGGTVLRFRFPNDDWDAFYRQVLQEKQALIAIDGVDNSSGIMMTEIAAMLAGLSENQYAILAGRAQQPSALHSLCVTGMITVLGREFVLFSEEEIIQLFLEYGIELRPSDVREILDWLWGWPFSLHILARMMQKGSESSLLSLIHQTRNEIKRVLVSDVVLTFLEAERQLLYNLSPFERFSEDMARIVTGRNDAPRMMEEIARKSYMLLRAGEGEYSFIPIVRQALFSEMRNLYTQDYINEQYKRAALYHELQNQVPKALSYYRQLGDKNKIRDLLIRDAFNRPADGDYVDLLEGYAVLDMDTILSYPELIKGKCEIESLRGHAEESERWYQTLVQFIRQTPARDARRKTAEEAKAYLDLCLSHRGSKNTLQKLLAAAKAPDLLQSSAWRKGFSVSGNSVSLMNGGLDFCRWAQHGWRIYHLFKIPIEMALGRGGSGVADIAIAERELEARPDGDYSLAMRKVREGIQRIVDNPDIYYAAIGIQSRILAAQGNPDEAIRMMDHAIASLSDQHPKRLKKNLEAFRMDLALLRGETAGAGNWMETEAPDETGDFIIMDRYQYMLKLRIYLILGQHAKVPFLAALLRQYFESYDRPYMLIQLNLLEAVSHYRAGKDAWRDRMREALALARRYGLVRVIANEGIAIIDMLNEMELPQDPWTQDVLTLTRRQAAFYPNFMKEAANKPVFTDREYQVYSLMIAGYKNAKIASVLNISERTVKYFCGLIYQKLGVSTRAEALNKAAELGDIK
ncbi:MAG: hypothetical protein IKE24_06015 [Clostridia bacterium]|nr:hypothetical protein [Clostridia bacterium]